MSVYISMSDLDDSAFEKLPAGGIYKSSLDIAESHDISQSGAYGVKAAGTLWATVTDMEGLQAAPFESNALTLDIVAPPARLPPSLTKRGVNDYQGLPSKHLTLHQDAYSACTQRDLRAIMAAVHNCRNFVRRAKSAARCGGRARCRGTSSDPLYRPEELTPEERQTGFNEMITLALDTAAALA